MIAVVRDAVPNDMAAVHALIVELAVFEREPHAVKTTPEDLKAAFLEARFQCVVSVVEDAVVGFALWYPKYSTWVGWLGGPARACV